MREALEALGGFLVVVFSLFMKFVFFLVIIVFTIVDLAIMGIWELYHKARHEIKDES